MKWNLRWKKILHKDVIRESTSPWSARHLVPKNSENCKTKFRFCFDFRNLYSVTKFDIYPLPVFEEKTSNLHDSKYYNVLDCYSGFLQISIKEEHKERTGFPVPSDTISSTKCFWFVEELSNADGCCLERPSWNGVLDFHTRCKCIFRSV